MSYIKYLFCGVLLLSLFHALSAECVINPFERNAPLIIRPGNTTVVYPIHGKRTLKFEVGETVEFACPQRQVVVDGISSTAVVQATCISNTRFRVNGQRFIWSQISCSANPIAKGRFLNSNCGTNARLAEIGFQLDNNRFLRTITICFDTIKQATLYSHYDLPSSIRSADNTTPRPQFAQDAGFYNVGNRNVNQLYVRGSQRSTINHLIGLAATNTKYINNGLTHFLSRGHLTARADFIYGALQNATFRYINAAPQWQGFNMNNWNQVEIDTRNYAHNRNVDLQVWTGTYGIATLPHETSGADIPLSLYVNGNIRAIPVPAIFWKIVYNPTNKRGIVLIGLNNLYEKNVSKHVICQDISSQVNWLNWRKTDLERGYSYACTVASFRKVVTYAPNLNVVGCSIDINKLNEKHPLFLNSNTQDIIYPEPETRTLLFKENENFILDCPGTGKVQAEGAHFDKTISATCVSDEYIGIENEKYNVSNVVCSRRITSVARFTSNICWKQYREIEVGLELPENNFVQLYTTCYDEETKNILYSTFQMTKEIDYQTSGNSRPGWTEGKFYNLSTKLDHLYTNPVQRKTINRQIGLPDDDTTYVKPTGHNWLAKGHLTAKADFFYNAEQQSTFFYINSVPQWQTFNGYNWFYLERDLRNYVANNYVELTVYTGTYGISTLPHQKTGEAVPLYLYEDEEGNQAIPIPELFWKIAYDPIHKAGIAVLGVNNPYQTDISKSIICNDVSDKISWLNFDLTKVESGYMYACSIPDLKKIIKNLPNFKVSKLLT